MLKLGNTFFRETESVYLFLCTANVNSISWIFFCKFIALEFVTLCDDLFNYLIFFLIANVQPNLTILCMVHATQLQNVHQRVGQQTETVQQDLELAVLLRKFSQRCYL